MSVIYIFSIKEEANFKPRKAYLNKRSNVHIDIMARSPNPYCRRKPVCITYVVRQ